MLCHSPDAIALSISIGQHPITFQALRSGHFIVILASKTRDYESLWPLGSHLWFPGTL